MFNFLLCRVMGVYRGEEEGRGEVDGGESAEDLSGEERKGEGFRRSGMSVSFSSSPRLFRKGEDSDTPILQRILGEVCFRWRSSQ